MSAPDREQTMDEVPLSTYTTAEDIPEEPEMDDMGLENTSDAAHIYAPPPRIAARFYRPSNSRRRSSAASSRRNSLSSQHSQTSTRSLQRGCQSNHVAQHLRRASIIQERKARLAERAAHAEQVRLRAALARVTPRSSNTEERALAAQKAREKHLAQVAAACADEVKRAKRVAEEMKERKAAEEKRYRLEMEEKLAEAEKRRLQYKTHRRPRTSSSPSKKPAIEPPLLSRDVAARRIQSAWRSRQRRLIYEDFSKLELAIDQVRDATFEGMTQFVNEQKVLSATAKLLELLNLLSDEDELARQTATRTFLTVYLVLGHPAEVLSKDGELEQDLMTKAKDLVICFESTITKAMASRSCQSDPTQLETLHLANAAYVTAFSAWKASDSSIFIETMVASFVALEAIWQTVKDDTRGEVASDYRDGIRENQMQLLVKIKRLAGRERGVMLVKKAIRESRKGRRVVRPLAQVRPRPAIDSPETTADSEAAVSASLEAVSGAAPTTDTSSAGQLANVLAKVFSPLPKNRVIVHELAIDKEFRIEGSESKEVYNQTLGDAMRKGFEVGEASVWTVAMAENIRSRLLKLLKQGNSMYNLISDTLDPEFVKTQCEQGLFSYERFFNFMANILPKLCAPFRDAEVKAVTDELEKTGTVEEQITKFVQVLNIVDLLSLDYQNYLMMGAAPTLLKEAPGYEKRMFAQDLEDGNITLAKTKRWWHDANIKTVTEIDRRDPLHRPTTQKIYSRGLVDLAIATTPLQDQDLPETLELDKERLIKIRRNSLRIATISAILLTAKNLLRRDVRSQWKSEANLLWEALKPGFASADGKISERLFSIIESGRPMPDTTKSQLASTITRLVQQAERGRLTDPVIKLIFQRLKTHIFNRLSADSSGERVRVASTASEGLASSGMVEFVPQVGDIVDTLSRMGEVDRKAHAQWYEQIAQELEAMEQAQEGERAD